MNSLAHNSSASGHHTTRPVYHQLWYFPFHTYVGIFFTLFLGFAFSLPSSPAVQAETQPTASSLRNAHHHLLCSLQWVHVGRGEAQNAIDSSGIISFGLVFCSPHCSRAVASSDFPLEPPFPPLLPAHCLDLAVLD